jgi:hypothetical protein
VSDPIAPLTLPFPAAMGYSPNGSGLAYVSIDTSPTGALQTVCRLRKGAEDAVVWRSNDLAPTADGIRIIWSSDSKRFAVGLFRKIVVSDLFGVIWEFKFDRAIGQMAFANCDEIVTLAGSNLYCCHLLGGGASDISQVWTGAAAFAIEPNEIVVAVSDGMAITMTGTGSGEIGRFDCDGATPANIELACHPVTGLFLCFSQAPQYGVARTTVLRCADQAVLFKGDVGIGIAEPSFHWDILADGALAITAELDDAVAVWTIDADGHRQRVNDAGIEVELAKWSPDGQNLFISGRDRGRPDHRECRCVSRNGAVYWTSQKGAASATWRNRDHFTAAVEVFAQGRSNGWVVRDGSISGIDNPTSAIETQYSSAPVLGRDHQTDMISSIKAGNADFAVVYMMGPHRLFTSGAERLFYHHAIRANLEALSAGRGKLVGINGAGTLGAGREHRWAGRTDYLTHSIADIDAVITLLRKSGVNRIGLVGASLGCLPVISYLSKNSVEASVLVNPVYSAEIPSLKSWRHMFGADASLAFALEVLAPAIRSPIAIIHGQQDPISPSLHSSDFVMQLAEDIICEYTSVPHEGHIFQSDAGWRRMLQEMTGFLDRQIGSNENGEQ